MTHEAFDAACKRADAKMKRNDGHQFVHILKTRCQLCGRGQKQKGKCPHWLVTFLDHLYQELAAVPTHRAGHE